MRGQVHGAETSPRIRDQDPWSWSDLVRAEFDDVELWEAPEATWLRTGGTDMAALYGLIKRIEALGLVLLAVDTVDADESDRHGKRAWRPS